MEKMRYIIIALFIVAGLMAACDRIEGPYIIPHEVEDVTVEFPPLDPSSVFRKLLIEEYTGHYCPNCPDGHDELDRLHTIFGDTLVMVGIHAGALAAPQATHPEFSYDFRTDVGNELRTFFNIDGIPVAIINRYPSIVSPARWQTKLTAEDRTPMAAIQLINQYDASGMLKVNAKVTMLADYPNALRLSLFLVEDNVIKPQLKHSETILDYSHKHVLRAGLNGTFGDLLTADGILQKDEAYTYGHSIAFAGHDWNPDNCSVVAILHDKANGKVLQVEQLRVK
jgi:hypothetical protein